MPRAAIGMAAGFLRLLAAANSRSMSASQSGTFGYRVLEARPDKVKALVAVEPTLGGDRNKVQSIKATPILVVYGDNAKDHPRWSKIRQGGVDYAAILKS